MWKFLKNSWVKIKRKWWLWILIGIERIFEDRIHGWLNAQIDLYEDKIMVFIEKIFSVPLGIGGVLFFIILIVLLIKTYCETRKSKDIEKIEIDGMKIKLKEIKEEPSSDIAFEEEIIIKGTYHHRYTHHWEHKITWKELFKLISPDLLGWANEYSIKLNIATSILRIRGITRVNDKEIDEENFKTIKVQFLALGLIRTRQGRLYLDWTLTDKGKSVMLKERTISKPPLKIEYFNNKEEYYQKLRHGERHRISIENLTNQTIKDICIELFEMTPLHPVFKKLLPLPLEKSIKLNPGKIFIPVVQWTWDVGGVEYYGIISNNEQDETKFSLNDKGHEILITIRGENIQPVSKKFSFGIKREYSKGANLWFRPIN